MRLIDADHLPQIVCVAVIFSIVCSALILPDGFRAVFRKLVAGEPTVDRPTRSQFKRMAVQLGYEPIVHCKDCKHSWEDIGGLCCSHGVCVDCTVPEDFFCADGERKNDFVDGNKIGERKDGNNGTA